MDYKAGRLFVSLALGLGLILVLIGLLGPLPPVARADPGIHYVAPGGDCGGAMPCHATVQEAVDAADSGDVIRIAASTYADVSTRAGIIQVIYISKTVTIRGGYTTAFIEPPNPSANPTILDALGQGRVLYITGNVSPTIEGLRITNGVANGLGGGPAGNDAGGGVYAISATVTISNCRIFSNTGSVAGTGYGGGLYLRASLATLDGNTITLNSASLKGGGEGGGLYLYASDATLRGNVFTGNTAQRGGGLYLSHSAPIFTNTVVADNQATSSGAGIYIFYSSPHLLHTTIARNNVSEFGDGSGVKVTYEDGLPSTVALTNTILTNHELGINVTAGSTITLYATLWYANSDGNWNGLGTIIHSNDITGPPALEGGGYHLTFASAAIDAAVDAGVTADVDGQPRPVGRPDLGADEWGTRGYLPLVFKGY